MSRGKEWRNDEFRIVLARMRKAVARALPLGKEKLPFLLAGGFFLWTLLFFLGRFGKEEGSEGVLPAVVAVQEPTPSKQGIPPSLPSPSSYEWKERVVVMKRGETLETLLIAQRISPTDTLQIISSVTPLLDLHRLQVGERFTLTFGEDRKLAQLVVRAADNREIVVTREGPSFSASENIKKTFPRPYRKRGLIKTSLYEAAVEASIPEAILMDLVFLYSFDVDFQRDLHPGDSFEVAYDMIYDEKGHFLQRGHILYARLHLGEKIFPLYRYQPLKGKVDYFDERGKTARKALLKTPLNGAYITSGFGMRRHPILGYSRLHRGIDFGARRGTPIRSAGAGRVVLAKWSKFYGYHVKVAHRNGYATLYAHMSRMGRGIKRGVHVVQGDILGAVGATGLVTGPHLHYEIHRRGRPINPSFVKFPPSRVLAGDELRLFHQQRRAYLSSLE